MTNIHGFGPTRNVARNLPPVIIHSNRNNNNNDNPGIMGGLGQFNEPVIEDQLRIA